MPCIKSFVPECDKMFSELLDTTGSYYNFIVIDVAPIKILVTTFLHFLHYF